MVRTLVLSACALLLGALAAARAAAQSGDTEVIAFVHRYKNERVGVTRIDCDPSGFRYAERFALDFPLSHHPLGTYTDATFEFNAGGRLIGYRFATVAEGKYHERRAEIERTAADNERRPKRPVLVEYSMLAQRGQRTPAAPRAPAARRTPLLKDRPLLLFDLNLIAPLVRFGRDRRWRDNFNALHQVSPLALILVSATAGARTEDAFWLKRTARARVEVDDRMVACTVFALHLGDRDILISLATRSGELLRIEEPALGYEIRRTYAAVPTPKPRGLTADEVFRNLDRLGDERALGIDLGDRRAFAEVEYAVDIPYAAATAPTRPWQVVDAEPRAGRLQGKILVRAATERPAVTPGAPPKAKPAADAPDTPDTTAGSAPIRARADTLFAAAKDPLAYLEAVVHYTAREIGLVYNIHTAERAIATGFGSVRAKAQLAASLLQAREIPTRDATGLVYTGSAFVFHRWIEAYLAAHGGWVPADPVLDEVGTLSPLHITLGTPWNPPKRDGRFALRAVRYRFLPGKAGKRDKVRWPDGEKRVYGFFNKNEEGKRTLYGYLASRPQREPNGEIRLRTDLIIDLARLGASGYLQGEAVSIFDSRATPRWFSFQTWIGGKRNNKTVRVAGNVATMQETGQPARRIRFGPQESDVILAVDSFYDHWTIFFAALDPAKVERMTVHVLRPAGERVYRWTLIRRKRERLAVPGLEQEVDAWVFDLVEWNLRFWVTEGRVLVKVVHTPSATEVLLERETIRERF